MEWRPAPGVSLGRGVVLAGTRQVGQHFSLFREQCAAVPESVAGVGHPIEPGQEQDGRKQAQNEQPDPGPEADLGPPRANVDLGAEDHQAADESEQHGADRAPEVAVAVIAAVGRRELRRTASSVANDPENRGRGKADQTASEHERPEGAG